MCWRNSKEATVSGVEFMRGGETENGTKGYRAT